MGLHQTKKLQTNKQTNKQKTKEHLHSKGSHQQNRKVAYKWEEIVANHLSEKGLTPKIHKELLQLNSK